MKCLVPGCGLDHDPLLRCEIARARVLQPVVGECVVHISSVVHAATNAVVHKNKGEARYKDAEARKAYRREWMKRKRAEAR